MSIGSYVSFGAANNIDRAAAGNSISLRKTLKCVSVNSAIIDYKRLRRLQVTIYRMRVIKAIAKCL
jgi:hypothetical protein